MLSTLLLRVYDTSKHWFITEQSTANTMGAKKLTLKLLVDKKANKVLFAEANKDFIDFLLSLMSVPVGSVISLLSKEKMVGCLGDLYESIENLSVTYMQPNQNKDSILRTNTVNFAANAAATLLICDEPTSSCEDQKYYTATCCYGYVTNTKGTACPCGRNYNRYQMNKEMTLVGQTETNHDAAASTSASNIGGDGGFVKGVVTYMVMDNLAVMPMSTISSITMLNKFNVHDVGVLEEKVVRLRMEEGLKLLEASFQSKTVLTDVFLAKKVK